MYGSLCINLGAVQTITVAPQSMCLARQVGEDVNNLRIAVMNAFHFNLLIRLYRHNYVSHPETELSK
jgi:hypothetical protein